MNIEILTIVPEVFQGFFSSSIVSRAIEKKFLTVRVTNIRDFAKPPHYHVDDAPYGGGPGMVMKPEPLAEAIEDAKSRIPEARVILLSPAGTPFTQQKAKELSLIGDSILVCGRFEGVDQRIIELYVDEEISIGDYILMGGEVPAMVLIEACLRLVPGVLGNAQSAVEESFTQSGTSGGILEAPQYTRPPEFRGRAVPEVLMSGNHDRIRKWRKETAEKKTKLKRPDLLSDKTPA